MYCGESTPRTAKASVASRTLCACLYATAAVLADDVQIRQMCHSGDGGIWFRRAWRPIEYRAAECELSLDPVEALSGGGQAQHQRRVAQGRTCHRPRPDARDIGELEAD